jgi:hypothetical protein
MACYSLKRWGQICSHTYVEYKKESIFNLIINTLTVSKGCELDFVMVKKPVPQTAGFHSFPIFLSFTC